MNWLWKLILPDKIFNQLKTLAGHASYMNLDMGYWLSDDLYYADGRYEWPVTEHDHTFRIETVESMLANYALPHRWFWEKIHDRWREEHRQKWVIPRHHKTIAKEIIVKAEELIADAKRLLIG